MINLLRLFYTFFKIGLFTFGGGYAMIPMILEETTKFENIEQSEIIDFIAISETTPGPFAVNIATFIGFEQNGILGSIFATLGVILPSFIIILLLVNIIEKVKNSKIFKSIIKTVMPIILGLIFSTVLSILLSTVFNIENIYNIKNEINVNTTTLISLTTILTIISGLYLFKKKKLAPIFTILICASLGIFISYLLI